MKRKFLAMLLCLSMVFNMFPLGAFADEPVGKTSATTVNVDFTAQAEGSFLFAPQFDVAVSSQEAENYGYTDSVTGAVSALDVLVKAHKVKFGDQFTAENAKEKLAFNEQGMVSKIFGVETLANGFILNHIYPKIDDTGSTVQTQSVANGDSLEFFIYQSATYGDCLAWFMQGSAWAETINGAPNAEVQLKLMSLPYMNAGSFTLDIHQLGTAVSGAKLAWVAENGTLTDIDGAVTATDGTVALTLPETEGAYRLTAYLPSGSNDPLILSLTDVVVAKSTTVADPCALTALSVGYIDSNPNALDMTPAFSSDVTKYEVAPLNYQGNYMRMFYVKATAASAEATINAEMNGVSMSVTSGDTNWTILGGALVPGEYKTLTVTVTNGKDTKVYTVDAGMKDESGNAPTKPAPTPTPNPGEGGETDEDDSKTEDTEVAGPMQGKGTAEEPYVITNTEHFKSISSAPAAYYVLGANLAPKEWTASVSKFIGTLDGNGYTITLPDGATKGLFSTLKTGDGTATIKNLRVVANNMVSADAYPGILASNAYSAVSGNITNCAVEGKITVSNAKAEYVGGLLGRLSDRAAAVKNSYAAVSIINTVSTNAKTGALLGGVQYGTVENCLYDSTLFATGINGYTGTGVTGKTTAELKAAADILNKNLPEDCIAWKNDSTGYPVFASHNTVISGAVSISATVAKGETLTAEDTFSGGGTKTYQWYRVADNGTETAIDGATAKTYTVVADDEGNYLKVVVKVANAIGGNRTATTADKVPVTTVVATPADVLVTIANNGFAKAKDGTPMYQKTVTVTDVNKDGKLSLDEALQAAHTAYNTADGYKAVVSETYGNLFVQKLWGVSTTATGYYKNNVSTKAVDEELVAAGDKITAFIYQDAGYKDKYTYFNESENTVSAGKKLTLKLNGAVEGTPVGTYNMTDGSFTAIEGATLDVYGKASVTFATTGTYYVGPKAEFTSDSGTVYLVPAICKVTVTEATGDGGDEGEDESMQGKGTAEEPFIVKTMQHLIDMGTNRDTLGMYYVLANDITITNWEHAIGYYESINHAFTGTLDGNGYTITMPDGVTTGLFSGLKGDYGSANVRNLRVVANNMVAADAYPGILVSNTLSGVGANISNCAVEGKITVNNENASFGGGLLGRLDDKDSIIKNSYAAVNIVNTVGTNTQTGALLGSVQNGTVENCLYDSTLFATGIGGYTGTGVTGKTTAELKAAADILNKNLPEGAIAWKNDSTGYPVFNTHKDIINGEVVVTGEMQIGQVLTVQDSFAIVEGGTAIGAKTYQWYRVAEDGKETAIEGANSATYTIADEDSACKLKVVVDVANAVGGSRSFTTEDAVLPAAVSVDVLVTIANNGFAKANDGTPMYQKTVTVADINKDGKLTLDEAMQAAHKAYNTASGYATTSESFGLSVSKLWGVETAVNGLCKNDVFTGTVDAELVAAGDKITAFIYQDKTGYSDKYTYFTDAAKTVRAGEDVALTLNTLGYSSHLPLVGAPLGVYSMTDGNFSALNVSTGADGKATVKFDKAGTYYVGVKAEYTSDSSTVYVVPAICKVTVLAAIDSSITSQWPNFRGSDNNMAIVTAKTPQSADKAALKWVTKVGDGDGMGSYLGAPIIVGDSLIVSYQNKIAKINLSDGKETTTTTMSSSIGYASAVPATYAEGMVFRTLNGGVVEAFNARDLSKVWTYRTTAANADGWQGQSPITYANGRLYVGFGGNSSGNDEFVCLDAKTGEALWTYSQGLYYGAGAVAIGNDYVAVGNDSGNLLVFKQTYGKGEAVAPVSSLETGLGAIRSCLAYSDGRVYFTAKGKYIASAAIDSTSGAVSDLKSQAIPYESTSTPVVYGDYVYFGHGGHFKNGGDSFVIAKKSDLSLVKSVPLADDMKSSALLSTAYESEGELYFYVVPNTKPHAINLVKVNPAKLTTDLENATEIIDLYVPETEKQEYCMSSIICDTDGTLYYRNDGSYLFAIKNGEVTGGSGSGSGSGGNGGTTTEPVGNIKVTFSLLGDTKHGDGGKVHTLAGKNLTKWIGATTVTVKSDATVYDVFDKVLKSKDYTYTIRDDGYVSAVTTPQGLTLSEMDNGSNSGWKYTLNGKYPNKGIVEQDLSNGDKIIFHYTDDYTKEDDEHLTGGGGGGGSSATSKEEETKKETVSTTVTPEVKADKNGEAKAEVKADTIKDAISDAKTDKADEIVIAPKVDGDASKVTVTIPAASANAVAKDANADLKVKTDIADIKISADDLKSLGTSGNLTISAEKKADGTVEVKVTANGKDVQLSNGTVSVEKKSAGANDVLVIVKADGTEEVIKKSVTDKDGITAVIDGSCTVKVVSKDVDFADTDEHWSKEAAEFVAAREIFNGTGAKTFAPNDKMDRQMVATVLWRLENEVKSGSTSKFNDEVAGWAKEAVVWAADKQIVNGDENGNFNGDQSVSRQELATMLYRYAKAVGMDTTVTGSLSKFTDSGKVADWATEAMKWAVGSGLMKGNEDGTINPNGTATRGEVATVIMRLIENAVK